MKVQDILRTKGTDVVTIGQGQSLHDAARILAEHRIGVLLAVDRNDQPAGILSERDIVRVLAASGSDVVETKVRDAMTEDMITAQPTDNLNEVMSAMMKNRIRHLPILNDGKLAGLISIRDVMKAQLAETETEAQHLRDYITNTR